jgi:hypothetical protein
MTLTLPFSQTKADLVQGCHLCPLGRHLDGHRFVCADRLYTTSSTHQTTQECHQAIVDFPHKYHQPRPLPDLQDIDAQIVCDAIGLAVDWLNPTENRTPAGQILIEVKFQGYKIGAIYKTDKWYSSDRSLGTSFIDPHYLALHLIHPDYLYGIVDRILAEQKNLALEIATLDSLERQIATNCM